MEGGKGVYKRVTTGLDSAEAIKHPWAFQCTKVGCHFAVSADSQEHATQIQDTHPCPYAGGSTTYSWSIVMTLVEQVWKKLDDDMLSLMQPEANTDFASLKARMRAFAEVLAIFMVPHFRTADEVAREAKRRYDNRLDPEYATAGLNQRKYEAPPGTPHPSQSARSVTVTTSKPAAPVIKLSDKDQESIKFFAANGFTPEVLAKTHGVSVAVIKAVLAG